MTISSVAIIGSGVIGTACAHYLRQAGVQVTVIDKAGLAKACSHANCGLICPSHALPLAEPGAVREALKAVLKPKGPFSIKLRWDPALWVWFFQFARRCNQKDMLESARARLALLASSRDLFDDLVRSGELECEWATRGLLYVYRSESKWLSFEPTAELLKREFDVDVQKVDRAQLLDQHPALKQDVAGGWHFPLDAHVRPDRLMHSWHTRLSEQGVQFHAQQGMQTIETASDQVTVVTDQGQRFVADAVVVATGAWTSQLAKAVGVKLPIQPGKGYSLTMNRPDICPATPMIFPECKVAVTPMDTGYRLGSTMQFAGYDQSMDESRLELLKQGAADYLKQPYGETIEETWYGWRPMTVDGLPFIDRVPERTNLWVAAGHNMLGLSMAPATGKLLAELMLDQDPHIDPRPYRVDGRV